MELRPEQLSVEQFVELTTLGFGRVYMEEVLDDTSKMFHIKLGDDDFYVLYKNDIIISIHYMASI